MGVRDGDDETGRSEQCKNREPPGAGERREREGDAPDHDQQDDDAMREAAAGHEHDTLEHREGAEHGNRQPGRERAAIDPA